jgi:hypothetical protein
MIVTITALGAALVDPRDCSRFHVEADGAVAVDTVLQGSGAGSLAADGLHANIEIAWIRRSAAGSVDDTWKSEFAAMITFAESSGWLVKSGSAIQAHVVVRTEHRQT